jgi:hypothetical protein
VLVAADNGPRPDQRTVQAYDLATLTDSQARALEGKCARFRVELDSLPVEYDGGHLFECCSCDGVTRSVWLPTEYRDSDTLAVEATLRVLHHAAWGPVPPFVEYRLIWASPQ